MKRKGLFIIIGESFRYGGQGSRNRGIPESYDDQLLACKSHIDFFNNIKNEVDIELSILTYETQYQDDLIRFYSDFNNKFYFYKDTIGFNNIFNEGLSKIEYDNNYDFIFIFRIDLVFKYNFFNEINFDKINYSSVCWMNSPDTFINHRNKTLQGKHRVVDVMVYVPKIYIRNLLDNEIKLDHNACDLMSDELYNDVNFILDTYHDSDSQKDRNPIYRISNRPESDIWYSEGYVLGVEPIIDKSKTYNKIFNKMRKIYLAIPYSRHEERSFKLANEIAAEFLKEGHIVFSPISMSHPIAVYGNLKGDWDTWKRVDFEFIKWCEEVVVVNFDNEAVANSVGVQGELEYAIELGKKISYYYDKP